MAATVQHGVVPSLHNHTIIRWAFPTAAEFAVAAGFVAGDIGKVAYVAETRVYHVLRNHDPISWDSLNDSATVAAAEYDAGARTLTLTLSNGATIVATDVAVPNFTVAEFKLTNAPVEVTFATSAGPVGTNARVIDVPARATVRINNFPVYDATVNWEPGDVCRNGSSAYYATVLTTGVFNDAHWREITDTSITSYINAQLATRPRVYVFTAAPTAGDDSADGYAVNDLWLDITAKKGYVATDVTVAAAVWAQFTPDIIIPWAEYNNGNDPVTAPEANFTDALALGNGAVAGATYAFAVLGNAAGADSVAIGRLSSTSGQAGIAIGNSAVSVGSSVAIGRNAVTGYGGEVAIGSFSEAGSFSTAVGSQADASGSSSVAAGNGATATGNYASAYGRQCDATQNYATSYGYQAVASGVDSTSVGARSDATSLNSVAVGGGAQATANYTIALGHAAVASSAGAVAIGRQAAASSTGAIAIGDQAKAQNPYGIKVGTGNLVVHENAACFGYYAGTAWAGQFVLPDLSSGTNYGRGGKKSFTTPAWLSTNNATPAVISIPVNTVYAIKAHRIEVEVLAHEPATDEVWTQKITGLLHDLAGTLTLVGTNSDTAITSGGLTVSAVLSISGTSLNITVTGEAGKTITWYTCVADLNSST